MKAVSVKTMRESDAACIAAGTPSKELMRRAGEAIFRAGKWRAPVAVVCGKGNNAGDGYVVAECLRQAGVDCCIWLLFDKFSDDEIMANDLKILAHNVCEEFRIDPLELHEEDAERRDIKNGKIQKHLPRRQRVVKIILPS